MDLEEEKEMIKRILTNVVLILLCLFIWLPLFLMAGNALMSEGEMLERFGAVFGMGNAPIKAALKMCIRDRSLTAPILSI